MLNLILFLLALLAMSINASTIPAHKMANLTPATTNRSIPIHENVFRVCNFPEDQNFAADCYCFGDDPGKRYAIDRSWAITAIDDACQLFTGGIGDPVSVYGTGPGLTPSYTFTFTYPASHDKEEGKIVIALAVDTTDPKCAGPLPVSWDVCWYTLHWPLDDCDDDAENGKNGGFYLKNCIWWVVDPAPSVNQPYPHGITCKDCGDPLSDVALGKSVVQ